MSDIARRPALPDDAVLVHLTGEICLASCGTVRDQLASAALMSPHLVVDLRDVEFMDCAGLSALMWARSQVLPRDGSFVIVAPGPQIRRLIEVAGLGSVLATVPHLRAIDPQSIASPRT